jgi:DNA-binding CsgD family transcriptional regulator
VTPGLLNYIAQSHFSQDDANLQFKLSKRELEVIRLICQEYSSKEIAALLQINSRSVESYRERIQKKVGAKNMIGVVLFAIRNKIVHLN